MEGDEIGEGHRDHAEPEEAFRRFVLIYPNSSGRSLLIRAKGRDKCFK